MSGRPGRPTDRPGEPAEADPASRPPIVFLHGTRLTAGQWAAQVAALDDEFECHALDLPGHGRAAATPFRLDVAAGAVADELARRFGDRPAILVGLSLGGYVAMAVAATWPERVAGLAISGATAEPVGLRSLGYRALAWVFDTVPERLLRAVNVRFFRWRYPPAVAEPIVAGRFWFAGGAVALHALVGERFRPRLAAYPGPSLLINGELDLFFRPTERAFAAVAVDPRRVLIRRATHLTNLDQPAAFSAAIRAFARSVGDPSTGG